MSHIVSSRVRIADLGILKRVLLEHFPKLKWNEGITKYNWYGRYARDYHEEDAAYKDGINPKDYGKCSHMISMEGINYQIGVVERDDGTFTLIWDFYGDDYQNEPGFEEGKFRDCPDGMSITNHIGKSAEKIMSLYSQEYIRQWSEQNGFMLEEGFDGEGNLTMVMVGT